MRSSFDELEIHTKDNRHFYFKFAMESIDPLGTSFAELIHSQYKSDLNDTALAYLKATSA